MKTFRDLKVGDTLYLIYSTSFAELLIQNIHQINSSTTKFKGLLKDQVIHQPLTASFANISWLVPNICFDKPNCMDAATERPIATSICNKCLRFELRENCVNDCMNGN